MDNYGVLNTPVGIGNAAFDKLRETIDQTLKTTLLRMQAMHCDQAKMTVGILIEQEVQDLPDGKGGYREGVVPKFTHVVKAQIQLVSENKGTTRPEKELCWDKDWNQFYFAPIGTNQTTLFDEDDRIASGLTEDDEIDLGGEELPESLEDEPD